MESLQKHAFIAWMSSKIFFLPPAGFFEISFSFFLASSFKQKMKGNAKELLRRIVRSNGVESAMPWEQIKESSWKKKEP